MVLLGHNGAGKTTLINYFLGFYTDTDQHPFLPAFKTFLDQREFRLDDCAYVPETACLEPELSARDYFRMIATVKGLNGYNIENILKSVALDVDAKVAVKHYSKGMRQRLMLALSLLAGAGSIILDEPTSGLDPYGRELVEDLIVALKDSHHLILSTHSLELALRLDEEIWFLREGEIVFDGRVGSRGELNELMERYRPKEIQ